jgi:hypothetical protein
MASLLPFAYALVGTLYLAFQLKKLAPDYSIEHINSLIQQPYLIIWALLSIFFWIPALGKKTVISLFHSLVFFSFLVRDLFMQLFDPSRDRNILNNDMKVYVSSLILNLGAFVLIILLYFIFTYYKKRSRL